MKVQTIKQSIDIKAPKEKVWDVLLKDQYTRIWYAEFSEGSHADTDWKVGSKAVFTDNSKSGLISKVLVNQPNEVLSMEYEGIVIGGVEDYDSEEAKKLKGGHETYRISEKNGSTNVSIESDMSEEYLASMTLAWKKALQKVKELSEEK